MPRTLEGLPLGRGFGYVWSLKSEALFGGSSFTSAVNPFVYVHNDFLFWTLELGLIGLTAMIVFWARLVAAIRRINRWLAERGDYLSYVGGVALTMFVASFVDNGLFIRPVAERFFVVAGMAFALADRSRSDEDVGSRHT